MRVNVLMEIDPGKGQMWIRLYDQDAETLRDLLVPGSRVAIYGIVSVYEASGGYPVEEPPRGDDDLHDRPDLGEVVRTDRFQLNSGSLEIELMTSFENER